MKRLVSVLLVLTFFNCHAQKPQQPDAAELLLKLKKLNVLATVLYVAAHPDDENTRLIAYMANEKLARTAYLSLTRGDGGQNLIGPEIREGLGMIRTQELLAARRQDGGEQFFSRANDFGYSKSAEETLNIWNEEQVLSDVVRTFRKFKPDVVITRFPPDERAGHGHHTTSAIMAERAFDAAADAAVFPGQIEELGTWQARSLYTNTGRWWNPNMTGDEDGVFVVDVGEFNPLLGTSYTELAAISRSQHKSQGFGSTGSRGRQLEFLEIRKGKEAYTTLFEGIDTTWGRVGQEEIGTDIDKIIADYNPMKPSASVPALLAVRKKVVAIDNEHWKSVKLEAIDELIKGLIGLYVEAAAERAMVSPGGIVELNMEFINRSDLDVVLESVNYAQLADSVLNKELNLDERLRFETQIQLPENTPYSMPYWLRVEGTLGMYTVNDETLIGKPENAPALEVTTKITVNGTLLNINFPVIYKWNDPVDGELYRPFGIVPPIHSSFLNNVHIYTSNSSKEIAVKVTSVENTDGAVVRLDLPKGWKVSPASIPLGSMQSGEEKTVNFNVTPPSKQSQASINAIIEWKGKAFDRALEIIAYDHIPTQLLMPKSTAEFVRIPITTAGQKIGYVQGAGDAIPENLGVIGYDVTLLNEDDMNADRLDEYDAIILGVRALNTVDRIDYYMPSLLEYVKQGGNLILQYNTNRGLKTDRFAPYPLEISRDRVTDETAEVRMIAQEHPVLNWPNKITKSDFDHWVQERGLYFPDEWSKEYTPILSSNDPGEQELKGGLLVARYGKGYYVYSGYSWFRQLPAAVPGAYRLFVNLISLGQDQDAK